jgi:rare lipoprotein A
MDAMRPRRASWLVAALLVLASPEFAAAAIAPGPGTGAQAKPQPDLSGLARIGTASYYANWFAGRTMADGTPMNPNGGNAASRTLPLGTVARVTNLATQRSAIVTIRDRGPYVNGRIVDLSPATARAIGLTPRQGLARVEVSPILVPLPDGGIKLGDAARRGSQTVASAD